MKLRCTADSIRLRVRKSDLENLQKTGEISSSLHFGSGSKLEYVLQLGQATVPTATYHTQQIKIVLPQDSGLEWIKSEAVSIEHRQEYEPGLYLQLLIEKDFPCRHTEEKDLHDTFFELAPKDDPSC